MIDKFSSGGLVPATHEGDEEIVLAGSKGFLAFDDWMDEALDALVAQWIHAAAPNASRISRRMPESK
jgi:UDP-N-acetylglucosamine:LPS N-acetylglucosamine transferase